MVSNILQQQRFGVTNIIIFKVSSKSNWILLKVLRARIQFVEFSLFWHSHFLVIKTFV